MYDIPELDLSLCADRLVAPVTKWGTRRRTDPMPGTWHCYANDYVFTHLIKRPDLVPDTGCAVAVEPNFSTHDLMAGAELIWWTYQKRRIARRWQQRGVAIVADLNVCGKAWEINFLGIPRGWAAYAVRGHLGVPFAAIEEAHRHACHHAGTEAILFVVFGGGRRRIGKLARQVGWEWVPEHRQVVAGLEAPYGQRH